MIRWIVAISRTTPAHAITLNWLGSSLYLFTSASLTAAARFCESSLTNGSGVLPLHRSIGVALDHNARRTELPSQFRDFFQDVVHVRIVKPLNVFVALFFGDFFGRSKLLGKKWITTVLVRISSRALNLSRRLWHELDGVLILFAAILVFLSQLVDHRKVHYLIERDALVRDLAYPPIEVVGLIPDRSKLVGLLRFMKNWKFSAQFVLWASPSISKGIGAGKLYPSAISCADLLTGVVRFEIVHSVENAADQSLDDLRVLLGKIGPGEPDVGDQLVCRGRRDEHPVAADLFEVVNVRCP